MVLVESLGSPTQRSWRKSKEQTAACPSRRSSKTAALLAQTWFDLHFIVYELSGFMGCDSLELIFDAFSIKLVNFIIFDSILLTFACPKI